MKSLVFGCVLFLASTSAQILQNGVCNENIQLQQNFNPDQFAGPWYIVRHSTDRLPLGDCGTFEIGQNNGVFTFNHRVVDRNFAQASTGGATYENGTARFSLNLNGQANPVSFWIYQTNYEGVSVAYSCQNVNANQRSVSVWALARQQVPSNLQTILITNALNELGIVFIDLPVSVQNEQSCTVLPVIGPGQPIILEGFCEPNMQVVQNFNATEFLGTWHEVASYYSESALGTCARAEYADGGDRVLVTNSQVVNQALETFEGYATVSSADNSAVLNVTLEILPNVFVDQDLRIIASDYSNYAISYSCVNLPNNQRRVFSWILSRNRVMPPEVQTVVNGVIDSMLDLNNAYYQATDQSDDACFYWPEPSTDSSIAFRGPCPSISAVANFDPVAYMGKWYDIESYPTGFQGGACNNANYTLIDGVVDVFNTQVMNQTLDTMRGTAVLNSDDGTGKLLVSFPIAGTNASTQTDYWVLSTDYSTYSLVYSCTYNPVTDMKTVFSWKLSRSKQLLASANTAINNVIANIRELDPRYYINRDQSPEACYYIPEPRPGEPVVFPGSICGDIPVVSNFSLSDFAGTWYEIEAYPKDFQPGRCVRHEFTQTGNNLNLVTFSVNDQVQTTSNSVVTSVNGAQMTITINTGDSQTTTIPFWILSTDYENYALAYSCVKRDDDFRAIYTWKLSKTQQMNAASNTAINNFISTTNNDVLSNLYFENVGQTNDDCFYFPNFAPGEPMILDGVCDLNIDVVQNFQPARYEGLWHLIETYPSEYQGGNCNDATYTIQDDGSVLVFNTQVMNQTLDTMTGSAVLGSTDGSGKLIVTFPTAPQSSEYWILDTDYDTYSFVYSCRNLANNQRRVWSWKLSRTRSLTATATAAMNQIIDNVQVLNNRFYQKIDKSDKACFYMPEFTGQPVRFRGLCDQTIPTVTNFQAGDYLGVWYDIMSYPQPFQPGTCSTAHYGLLGSDVHVYNTQVLNQTLDAAFGLAVLNPTPNNEAKLTVSFPIPGTDQVTSTPYWVLSTDYSNYAFIYSCVDLGVVDDYPIRSVSSWKLSRERFLAPASNNAINAVLNTIEVLSQDLYVVKGHTDSDCFYNPEPVPGKPVVYPGICNDSIQAVPNFDLSRFANTWYEIETYPKDQVTGQCISHNFSVSAANAFNLVSNQVIDEQLVTTQGTVQLVSTDNSGRLTITINSDGQNIVIPYWIIDTDYDNYALAYSCVNLNSTFRGVYSWKLSRSQQLTPTSYTAINNAMANIDVLDNKFFEVVVHSNNACFYFPNLAPGEPMILGGVCDPNINVVQNFQPARYEGLWHLIETYPSEYQGGNCNDATYTIQDDGSVLVFNTQVMNQTLDTMTGSAVLGSTDGSGKLIVTFPTAPQSSEYWILDTDYDTYSFVYSCRNLANNQRRVWSWKLSRTRSLTATATAAMNQIIDNVQVLNNRFYQKIDKSDKACFYMPEFTGQPVRFRGLCDQTIPTVTNFQAGDYLGVWYDIMSYPQPFQPGTCSTAHYGLLGSDVHVYNTQVLNQTLDAAFGLAVLNPTPNNEAKLTVSFPIPGTDQVTSTPYWVLSTDYSNYAFIYSCVDLGVVDDYPIRSVSSWKLSRERFLAPASNNAINAVLNTIEVLSQDLYVVKGHTDSDCFYNPEPVAGKPVVYPGICNDSIQAVPNFDLSRFANTWYEIETYPKDQVTGQCISHNFSVSAANAFNLVSNQVIDEQLVTTQGTVQLVSTDNSGRLTITINSDGQNIVIPYWIIDTDYDNYALAYSCVNLNSTFRGVYSWKLSRSQQLTPTSYTAINNAMANIDVLDNKFFEVVVHSNNACFYFPNLAPGEPMILGGVCDPNINVVQNFQPARYEGLWHLIETYPSEYQGGNCNDATYTIQDDGSVLVFNTQVMNQTLDTMTGSAVLGSTDGSGKLIVTFPTAPQSSEYWILDTDYDTYSFVYSCRNLANNQRRVWSWKLSRTRSLTATATAAMNQIIDNVQVLNNRFYQKVDKSDKACFYMPEFTGQPVRFRGLCDQTIPTVTNFQAGDYLGVWYDIMSYPQPFQPGTCSTAHYGLLGSDVHVYNTQVLNQTLDAAFGLAVLNPTPNNEAKLTVSFPIPGTDQVTSTPYWVLSTDYSNYAFIYSCVDLGVVDDYPIRSVSSWKLSRERFLAPASNNAINAVLNTIEVLSQDLYVVKGHTDDDCFYNPEHVTGKPVVYPGVCNDNIQAVPNFDLYRFSNGIWHEIEAYPKEPQNGVCINYDFTATSASTLSLVNTQVIDGRLNTVLATANLVSNDGSGRLTININTGGTTNVDIPYWILATDYDDYALAYSCRNINSTFREVWSWKLSKQKQLSTNANSAIASAMANIEVLDQRHYETVPQTGEACFYYPELSPTEPVTFKGLCNLTIPVVQDFNSSAFAGRWFDIESYFDNYQGDCIDGTFTQNGNGFDVRLTQVVNETLDETLSQATVANDGSGKLIVTSNGETYEYWILATDYNDYALVYSCQNIAPDRHRVRSWKLSKSRQLSAAANTAINNVMNTIIVLDDQYYNKQDHSAQACYYNPEPVPGLPVEFRARCDESIAVVQNFNATAYLGTWYNIENYPTPFQNGTCNTAQYSANEDGSVAVYNTQVVNQRLDEMNGVAVVASTDGSAKLLVSFPTPDGGFTNTPYWVLATDYESYALVYSCVEINDEYKRVTSWKLSRSQAGLSTTANTVINNVMDSIPELQQRYYQETPQTEEACFYYPPLTDGKVYLEGQCPNSSAIDVVTNFNSNLFSGQWSEVSRFPSELPDGTCVTKDLSATGNAFSLTTTMVVNERLMTIYSPASVSDDGRGVISVVLTDSSGAALPLDVHVLATDYDGYALLYACRNVDGATKQIFSWQLSRTRDGLSPTAQETIDQIVSSNDDLFEDYYQSIDQSNNGCFYYPEFDVLPAEIELPGPCDETIRGVAAFNAASYIGRWFDIARYPDPEQAGACSRAEYSPNAEGVDVNNSQVVNQTLLTQFGTAVVSSTDGSGELTVTFVVNGETRTANYLVLATDYGSYALVYSCRNLANGNRRVSSWKLSRERTLSNPANAAINQVISNTQGLKEEYYMPVSQSEEDCFYIPEVDETNPVVFRGQCGPVNGVQNFNLQQYLGWWHEIETYHTGDSRVCTSSRFSGSNAAYQVVDTNVNGLVGEKNSFTVTATSNGVLTRTSASGAQETWVVLATDYESHALVYSCKNVDDEYKQVWYAKHSKTRALTQASQTSINNVITTNPTGTLHPQFFKTIDQGDDACFFYPLADDKPVTLPGQCDWNIPVVTNFQPEEYSGRWYQTERYPQEWETGDCTGAQYTLREKVVDVMNWQVIDGKLDIINGNATLIDSEDNGGRFIVELPSRAPEGQESSSTTYLYVLSTDYTSYALTYSCFNVNDFEQRVGVFKLSRTRTMPASATTAINNHMSTRRELDQRYFISVAQSEECEEPSSSFLVKSSFVVVLVCGILQLVL